MSPGEKKSRRRSGRPHAPAFVHVELRPPSRLRGHYLPDGGICVDRVPIRRRSRMAKTVLRGRAETTLRQPRRCPPLQESRRWGLQPHPPVPRPRARPRGRRRRLAPAAVEIARQRVAAFTCRTANEGRLSMPGHCQPYAVSRLAGGAKVMRSSLAAPRPDSMAP